MSDTTRMFAYFGIAFVLGLTVAIGAWLLDRAEGRHR